jgi:hypothetical protein
MLAASMTEFATLTRREVKAGKLTMGLTPRRLLSWANMVRVGMLSAEAFTQSVVQGTAPEDREALAMLAATSLDSKHAAIDALAGGEAPPAIEAPTGTVGPSATGSTIPDDQHN